MKFKEILLIFVAIFVICVDANENARSVIKGLLQTRYNSMPWLVALRSKPTNAFFCSGSLISERHVVSGE
jgi:hypothetical protein